MNKTVAAVGLLYLLLVPGGGVLAAGDSWAIKFSHESLDVVTVPFKDGSARSFYIMTFTLENKGGTDAKLGLHVKAVVGSNPKKMKTHIALPSNPQRKKPSDHGVHASPPQHSPLSAQGLPMDTHPAPMKQRFGKGPSRSGERGSTHTRLQHWLSVSHSSPLLWHVLAPAPGTLAQRRTP